MIRLELEEYSTLENGRRTRDTDQMKFAFSQVLSDTRKGVVHDRPNEIVL